MLEGVGSSSSSDGRCRSRFEYDGDWSFVAVTQCNANVFQAALYFKRTLTLHCVTDRLLLLSEPQQIPQCRWHHSLARVRAVQLARHMRRLTSHTYTHAYRLFSACNPATNELARRLITMTYVSRNILLIKPISLYVHLIHVTSSFHKTLYIHFTPASEIDNRTC